MKVEIKSKTEFYMIRFGLSFCIHVLHNIFYYDLIYLIIVCH